MLFNFKAAIVMGLVALTAAAPVTPVERSDLEVRMAKIPAAGLVCKGTTFTEAEISQAKSYGYHLVKEKKTEGKYPSKYGNKSGGKVVIAGLAEGGSYYEYPLITGDAAWKSGSEPGKFRVVFNKEGKYNGVVYHPVAADSSNFQKC